MLYVNYFSIKLEKITNGKKTKRIFLKGQHFFKPQVKILCIHKCIEQWLPNSLAGSKAIFKLPENLKQY